MDTSSETPKQADASVGQSAKDFACQTSVCERDELPSASSSLHVVPHSQGDLTNAHTHSTRCSVINTKIHVSLFSFKILFLSFDLSVQLLLN